MAQAVTGPDWICENPQAPWQGRDSQGECVFDGHLWILGGWFTPQTPNPRDVWKSADGRAWTKVLDVAPWEKSDLPAAMGFKGRLYMMGGRSLPGTDVTNQVWSSVDGADWRLEGQAGWSPRLSMGYAVFRDRMWILGGTADFYQHDQETMSNDVWSSADGKTWRCETDNAGWSKRAHGQALVFDDKLWMMGGGSWKPDFIPTNDIWCSEDGVNWEQVTDAAPWARRIWFGTVVYRDHMWVLGGWNREDGNFNDVWFSKNGRDWTQMSSKVIWSPRHEPGYYAFNDRIWIMAGAGGVDKPLNSEVWSLHLPEDWTGA